MSPSLRLIPKKPWKFSYMLLTKTAQTCSLCLGEARDKKSGGRHHDERKTGDDVGISLASSPSLLTKHLLLCAPNDVQQNTCCLRGFPEKTRQNPKMFLLPSGLRNFKPAYMCFWPKDRTTEANIFCDRAYRLSKSQRASK
jgi:hypothetical protein